MTVNVPPGYRERERRGLQRSQRRIGGVSDEVLAQRKALLDRMANERAGYSAPEVSAEPETSADPVAPAESDATADQHTDPAPVESDVSHEAHDIVKKTRKPKA